MIIFNDQTVRVEPGCVEFAHETFNRSTASSKNCEGRRRMIRCAIGFPGHYESPLNLARDQIPTKKEIE
jgi:hypothetical protein